MTVTLQCKLCRAPLLVAEGRAGQPMNCPRCGEQMIIPAFSGPPTTGLAGAAGGASASSVAAGPAAPAYGGAPESPGKDLNALRANMYPPGMEPPTAPQPPPSPPLSPPSPARLAPAPSMLAPAPPMLAPAATGVMPPTLPTATASGAGGAVFNLAPPAVLPRPSNFAGPLPPLPAGPTSSPPLPSPQPLPPPPPPLPLPLPPTAAPAMAASRPPQIPVPMSAPMPPPLPSSMPPSGMPPVTMAALPPAALPTAALPTAALPNIGMAGVPFASAPAAAPGVMPGAVPGLVSGQLPSGPPGGVAGAAEAASASDGARKKPPKPAKPAKPVATGAAASLPLGSASASAAGMSPAVLPQSPPLPSPAVQSPPVQSLPPQAALPPGVAVQSPPSQSPSRISQTARFIAADPSALRVQLGADGKLPELLLEDADKRIEESAAEEKAKTRSSPPWVLIGVFAASIAMSLAMLFVDVDGTGGGGLRSQAAARVQLKQLYAGDYPPLAPYQQRVRQALQAFQKGDRDEERRLLREVLDILHAESKSRTTGITGMIDAEDPPIGNPNDRHLESLISTLLAE
jgi:hypothetical protein